MTSSSFLNLSTIEQVFQELDITSASSTPDISGSIERLAEALKCDDYLYETKESIYVDYTFFNLAFCKEAKFTLKKTQVVVTLLENMFKHAQNSGFNDVDASYEVLKSGILECCEKEAAADSTVAEADKFTPADVSAITKFATRTIARYLSAYQRVFTTNRREVETVRTIQCETPLTPPPLREARLEGEEFGAYEASKNIVQDVEDDQDEEQDEGGEGEGEDEMKGDDIESDTS
eukprot:g614.t1